jgi:hypothetical protein
LEDQAVQDFIRIRDPRFDGTHQNDRAIRTLASLAGKTMVILNNGWSSMNEIADMLTATMKQRFGVADVIQFGVPSAGAAAPDVFRQTRAKADFVVVGLAN